MSYKYKSGAQKRKEKELKDIEARKGQQSIGKFVITSKSVKENENAENVPVPSSTSSNQNVEQATLHSSSMCQDHGGGETQEPESSPNIDAEGSTTETSPNIDDEDERSTDEQFCDVGDPNFDVQVDLRHPHVKLPSDFPNDKVGASVPLAIFRKKMKNGELVPRDWLVWSRIKQAFFCLPCKLFSTLPLAQKSLLASPDGYSSERKWKKLYDRVFEHESSTSHNTSYIQWRMELRKVQSHVSLNDLLLKSIESERKTWKDILKRLFHVTMFLAERGLAFRGDSCKIGDPSNGNFLGILELLANYDPVIDLHLKKVRESQEAGTRMQAHYLSPETQNELIETFSAEIIKTILMEREKAKYFSIIVDATPDSSHTEQTAFLLRYLHYTEEPQSDQDSYEVKERLLGFLDCSQKTGEAISELILSHLNKSQIPLQDCRGQGYDNGSNMKGAYKGVQAIILSKNNLAIYSACACHSLNLCGEQAAECCTAAITFFGAVQKLYNIFSSSPQRWEIFKKNVPNNLHSMSQTRWSARVDSVKPVARHLPGVLQALIEVLSLNLTAECRRDVLGLQKYLKTYNFLLLSSIWTKILQAVDIVNKVIQQRGGTLHVASSNLSSLIDTLHDMRNEKWEAILQETLIVAKNIGWPTFLEEESKRIRKRKRSWSDDDDNAPASTEQDKRQRSLEIFKRETYYVILDSIIGQLTQRFQSLKSLNELFSILWRAHLIPDSEIEIQASNLISKYSTDISDDLLDELKNLKTVYIANFGTETLPPLKLLNTIKKFKLSHIFPNVMIGLRIFLTIPATVASAERSFSTLKRVKSVLRSTMCQDRLSSLGVLAVEQDLVRKCDVDTVIDRFVRRKARKAITL